MTEEELNEAIAFAEELNRAIENIPVEIADETRRSRYRDPCSHRRVHPVHHDIMSVFHFATDRRMRLPGVKDAARIVVSSKPGDRQAKTKALRFLVDVILNHGATNPTIRRTCKRIEGYCDLVDAGRELLAAWEEIKASDPVIH
jgi:hypothetical protein